MREFIDQYIEAHEGAWAPTTLKSETSRLRAVAHLVDDGPEAVIKGTNLKPYALKTLLIRLVHFEAWLYEASLLRGEARFAQYMKKHKNRFKHAYVKEELSVTYDAACTRIAGMVGNDTASQLLSSGLRISELYSIDADGYVTGKGGKRRRTFGATITKPTCSKSSLRNALRKIGLKPHTLRKLCATRCAERGASAADLCKIFGWSDIKTAYQYLQPKDDARLEELMK